MTIYGYARFSSDTQTFPPEITLDCTKALNVTLTTKIGQLRYDTTTLIVPIE